MPDLWYSSGFLLQSHHQDQLWPWFGWKGASGFLPSLFKAGFSLWHQFRHVFIAPCRAVFIPNLDLLGTSMGPLVTMMAKLATGRVVLFLLCGLSSEPRKEAPHWGVPTKGMSDRRGTRVGGVPVG